MKKYFLETSVIINFLRGKQETIEMVKSLEGELVSSYVCLAELFEGVYRTPVDERNKVEKGVKDFFSGLGEIYGLDKEIAEKFGQIRAELKAKGKAIEDLDILVAATCLAYDLILVTGNLVHFKRIERLRLAEVNV